VVRTAPVGLTTSGRPRRGHRAGKALSGPLVFLEVQVASPTRRSSSSCSRIDCQTRASSRLTMLTQDPDDQKCRPVIRCSFSNYRWIRTALVPSRNPIVFCTLNLGGCSDTGGCGRASHALPTCRLLAVGTTPEGLGRSDAVAFRRDSPAIRRYDHNVVLALLPHIGQALPFVHKLLVPALGRSRKDELMPFSRTARRIDRSSSGRTAQGRRFRIY
jgi:hypothetical protein